MNFLKNTGLKNKKTYIKAYNYLQNGKFEESLRLFNYLLDENYRSFSILFNLITIHNELNSLDTLLNKINLLLDNEDYNYYELLIQKGNIFYLKKEYDEAIKCFDEILIDDSVIYGQNFVFTECFLLNYSKQKLNPIYIK